MDKILEDIGDQLQIYYKEIVAIIPLVGIAILIALIFLFISMVIRKRVIKYLLTKSDDPLLINFFNKIIRITNVIVGILLFLYIIGKTGIATSLLGAAGVSAFVIGFAFKDIGENFLAGIIMAFKRPFRIGDTIQTSGIEGVITGLSLRDTHVKTFDGKDVYIPNGQIIKNPLFNYTIDGFLRQDFEMGVDPSTDIGQARKIMLDSVNAIPGVLKEGKSSRTLIKNVGTSTVNIVVQYWIDTFDSKYSSVEIKSKAIESTLQALDQANIYLPSEIIELKNYNESSLSTN